MLRSSADFAALTHAPSAHASRLGIRFRVGAPTDGDHPVADGAALRVGIAAGRKVGGAVVRNRIRRRLKALLRDLAPQLTDDASILITVRAAAATASSAELQGDLVACLRRARLLEGGRA